MPSFLAILSLVLAGAAQIGTALITSQAMLDGLVAQDVLAVLIEPQTLQALACASIAAAFGALVVAVAAWQRRAVWLGPMLLPLLWPVALRLGPDTVALAISLLHASIGISLGTLCGAWRLGRLTPGMLHAAQMCGVSAFGSYWRVIVPMLLPGLLAAVALATLTSLLLSFLRVQADGAVDFVNVAAITPNGWLMPGIGVLAMVVLSGGVLSLLRKR